MALLDDLQACDKQEHAAGGHCSVGKAYDRLHEEHDERTASVFADRARDPGVDVKRLSRVLAEYGIEVGHQSITRHRRRDCLCHVRLGI